MCDLRAAGYDDLSADDLVKLRIHGADEMLRSKGQTEGGERR